MRLAALAASCARAIRKCAIRKLGDFCKKSVSIREPSRAPARFGTFRTDSDQRGESL